MFLGYIPKTLEIDETTLQGKLFTYRIKNGFTYSEIAKQVELNKSTVRRFEKGKKINSSSKHKFANYLSKKTLVSMDCNYLSL